MQETAALPHQAARLIIVVIFVLISRIPHVNVGLEDHTTLYDTSPFVDLIKEFELSNAV